MRENVEFLEEIYKSNVNNQKNEKILRSTARIAKYVVYLIELLYGTTFLAYTLQPFLEYYFSETKEKVYFLYVFFPGVNVATKNGYVLSMTFQFVMLVSGYVGTTCSDMYCFCVVVHLRPIQHIFRKFIMDLNRTLQNSTISETQLIQLQFRNILLMHKDIYRFHFRFLHCSPF